MTDKEIIIDGIDTRKCKHFEALYESRPNGFGGITIENYCYLYEDNCEKYPQCLYRSNQLQQLETQLKRKKQECEELKKEKVEIKKYLGISHKTILERLEELTDFRDRDRDELDQLKVDREEALKQLEFVRTLNTVQEAENRKLKQTIAKIKGICSEMNCESLMQNSWCGNTDFKMGCCEKVFKKQILQKISEDLNDD